MTSFCYNLVHAMQLRDRSTTSEKTYICA